jgi:signal peptidase II
MFRKTGLFYWWVILLVIVIDLVTKQLVVNNIPYQGNIELMPCLSLVHVYNTGAAFSFLSDSSGWQAYLFIGIALLAVGFISAALYRASRSKLMYCLSLALICGGAVGNVIDRVYYGYVIDFILFYIRGVFTYPAFNIADCAICIGVAILVVYSIFFEKKDGEKADEK